MTSGLARLALFPLASLNASEELTTNPLLNQFTPLPTTKILKQNSAGIADNQLTSYAYHNLPAGLAVSSQAGGLEGIGHPVRRFARGKAPLESGDSSEHAAGSFNVSFLAITRNAGSLCSTTPAVSAVSIAILRLADNIAKCRYKTCQRKHAYIVGVLSSSPQDEGSWRSPLCVVAFPFRQCPYDSLERMGQWGRSRIW